MTTLTFSVVLLLAQAATFSEPFNVTPIFKTIMIIAGIIGVIVIIIAGVRLAHGRDQFEFFMTLVAGATIAAAPVIYLYFKKQMPAIDFSKELTALTPVKTSVGYLHPKHERFSRGA